MTDATPAGGSGEMFDRIAARYDLLNRVLSLGIDGHWRKVAIDALGCAGRCRILDLATGTADLAIGAAMRMPEARVTGVDPSEGMLAVGRAKVVKRGLVDRVELLVGDGQDLAFEDDTFDGAMIAFGIRNFPDRPRGLREMARVTKPGAKVVVLELGEPRSGPLAGMARFHVRHVVPTVGGILSGQREYRYLTRSIAAFPPAPEFAALMGECGLEDVTASPLTFGAVNVYVGVVV